MALKTISNNQPAKTPVSNYGQTFLADGSVALSFSAANTYVILQNVFTKNDISQNMDVDGYKDGYMHILQAGVQQVTCNLSGTAPDGYTFEMSVFQNGVQVSPGTMFLASPNLSTSGTVTYSGSLDALVQAVQGDVLEVRLQETATDANGVTLTLQNATLIVVSL